MAKADPAQTVAWASEMQKAAFRYGPYPQLASGGFGCVAGDTRIYDAETGRDWSFAQLCEDRIAPVVRSWDVRRDQWTWVRASVPWLKGRAPLFRVTTKAGRTVTITDQHQCLLWGQGARGWGTVAQETLAVGGALAGVRLDDHTTQVLASSKLMQSSLDVATHPSIPESDAVVSIAPVGDGPFYDIHVPGTETYLAHGLVHHNSGKTYAYCLKALWLSDAFPRNRGVIFRTVAKDLRATTMATFRKICPETAYDGNRMEGTFTLKVSQSEILWLGLDNPELEDILKGLEINWFFGDQAEDMQEDVFDTLVSRLGRWDQAEVPEALIAQHRAMGEDWPWRHPTSGRPLPPQYPMLTCNPDTELHWLYRRFHPESPEHTLLKIPEIDVLTGQPTGQKTSYAGLGYQMFHMPSTDNQFLTAQNKANLLSQDEAFVRRYVRGEWGLPEGSIHVVDPTSMITITDAAQGQAFLETLRQTCSLHRTLDHGDAAPTCCLWWAVDRAGNAICYREYYQPNALISTHRAEITALSMGERYDFNLADPSIFHKQMQKHGGRWSVADEYTDTIEHPKSTALWWQPADNNELGTRNRINEYLQVDPNRVHPFTKALGAARLFFVTKTAAYPHGCLHAPRELKAQRRKRAGTEMGKPIYSDDRDPNIADHSYDCIRYFIASRAPVLPAKIHRAGPGTFDGASRLLREQARVLGFRGRR